MPAPTPTASLTALDLERLAARGIAADEARRQLEQLRRPPPALDLARPCTVGDGIERLALEALEPLVRRHAEAVAGGLVSAFVPASGAASRMFRELLACRHASRPLTRAELEAEARAGRPEAQALLEFVAGLDRLALRDALAAALDLRGQRLEDLAPAGPYDALLAALLDADGLDYASCPKALIPFHRVGGSPRTAFEEHLAEGAALYRDAAGVARLELTVPPDHLDRFVRLLARARARDESADLRYDVAFSTQDPATDTLAVDGDGEPFRDADGRLVLRPSGHGALLGRLALAGTPIVMIKNIDNIAAARDRAPTLEWTRALVGRLCELREHGHALSLRLGDPADTSVVPEARDWALGLKLVAGRPEALDREALRRLLDRPLRVCGMVANTGEPGGGPYWVRGRDGRLTRQIVESAQVRDADPGQVAVFRAATHFNPVFLACSLDDAAGQRHELSRFVDADAVIVTRRSSGGRELVALERPGLWNGGMAEWNTVFVEVPLAVFNPVKTVLDLLRPEHQGD